MSIVRELKKVASICTSRNASCLEILYFQKLLSLWKWMHSLSGAQKLDDLMIFYSLRCLVPYQMGVLFHKISLFVLFVLLTYSVIGANASSFDWRSDWTVRENFSISKDSEGYDFPTAIAFLPNPGKGPKDPLYFVTELRGKVKIVTNDRSVYTFAEDFFQLKRKEELPSIEGQVGLAGICLEPKHGYVFVTFAYQDTNKIIRNNIVRFQSKPETYSLKPTSQIAFTEVFSSYESSVAHQIGPCQIKDDLLYVSVGDGAVPPKSQQIDSILGKIIRMTLDGRPVPSNPFYRDSDLNKASNYVWAYGLRNPFGLKIVKNRIFVTENGPSVDRFMEIHKGENYLWDQTDWSIGTNAAVVWAPSVCPVQLDYYPEGSNMFPEQDRRKFYVALGGDPLAPPGPGLNGEKSIATLEYGFKEDKMLGVPKIFLKYRGSGRQMIVGLAFGPDGLYFVPLFPNSEGKSIIFKVSYSPTSNYPFTFIQTDPLYLMVEKGCLGCHSMNNKGGKSAPTLDRETMVPRIQARLNSKEYLQSLRDVELIDVEPYKTFKEARKEVLEAKGIDKIRFWMKYHIYEPKFDNPNSQMPKLGLNKTQALTITDYLLAKREKGDKLKVRIVELIRKLRVRYLLLFSFVFGFSLAFILKTLQSKLRA